MSAVPIPVYTPIIRRTHDGSVHFDGKEYHHDALISHSGSDVFCDMEVDVDTEMCCYRIYDALENEICVIKLDEIKSIGDAANGTNTLN